MAFDGLNIKENFPGKYLTTIKVGGPVRYFLKARTKKDLLDALQEAKSKNIKFYIIGSGSNLLIQDKGFDGILIKILFDRINFLSDKKVYAEAGASLSRLVGELAQRGVFLKFALGVPGTVGGAVYGNSGSQTEWMGNFISEVKAIDTDTFTERTLSQKECEFSYRKSVFHKKNNLIITGALFDFSKCDYNKDEFLDFLKYRRQTQPLSEPSFGSTFRGVRVEKVSPEFLEKIKKEYPQEKETINRFLKNGIIPAAWIIEKCGLKGFKIGGVKFSEKHSNFIVNCGEGKCEDVLSLINIAKQKAKEKFGIRLETEVQII